MNTESKPDAATPLLPNHVTLAQLAPELNPQEPPCERAVRNMLDALAVPYVKVLNVRHYSRDDVRAAILAREVNRQPRGRGRPRQVA